MITPYFDPERRSAHTWGEVYYQPRAGRLIAFPGWLVHATQPNMAHGGGGTASADGRRALERISVSFNFRQRRKDLDPAAAPANEAVRSDLPEAATGRDRDEP